VESPSLEIFQPRLAAVLCSLLWVTLLGQGLGLGDPQRALPTPNILWPCDSEIIGYYSPRRWLGLGAGAEGSRGSCPWWEARAGALGGRAGREARRETSRGIRDPFPTAVALGKRKPCQAAAGGWAGAARRGGHPVPTRVRPEAGSRAGQPQTFCRVTATPLSCCGRAELGAAPGALREEVEQPRRGGRRAAPRSLPSWERGRIKSQSFLLLWFYGVYMEREHISDEVDNYVLILSAVKQSRL